MVICLERYADLHTAQLMPLPLTDSCFSKIQIGFTFLVPAYPGSLGKTAVKRVCVCVCVCVCIPMRPFTMEFANSSSVQVTCCEQAFKQFIVLPKMNREHTVTARSSK